MPSSRAVFLIVLALLVCAAPAAASERSEARRYAEAMRGLTNLTPEEAEALVAGMEARSAHVVATCLPAVQAGAKKQRRREILDLLYAYHLTTGVFGRYAGWLAEGDDRLAAIPTRTKVLRKGRATRRSFTRFVRQLGELGPMDFCATVTAWEARGFKGRPPEATAIIDFFVAFMDDPEDYSAWERATKLLKRQGASRAERKAFEGQPDWPELREPAEDPVAKLLESERPADGVGTRQPWSLGG